MYLQKGTLARLTRSSSSSFKGTASVVFRFLFFFSLWGRHPYARASFDCGPTPLEFAFSAHSAVALPLVSLCILNVNTAVNLVCVPLISLLSFYRCCCVYCFYESSPPYQSSRTGDRTVHVLRPTIPGASPHLHQRAARHSCQGTHAAIRPDCPFPTSAVPLRLSTLGHRHRIF